MLQFQGIIDRLRNRAIGLELFVQSLDAFQRRFYKRRVILYVPNDTDSIDEMMNWMSLGADMIHPRKNRPQACDRWFEVTRVGTSPMTQMELAQ
jgi:hypothetical protein